MLRRTNSRQVTLMRPILLAAAVALCAAMGSGATGAGAAAVSTPPLSSTPPLRVVDFTAPDGTPLEASCLWTARRADPDAQLFPEISASIVGADSEPCRGEIPGDQKVLEKVAGA
jgi:hypothetical protein